MITTAAAEEEEEEREAGKGTGVFEVETLFCLIIKGFLIGILAAVVNVSGSGRVVKYPDPMRKNDGYPSNVYPYPTRCGYGE